MSFFDSLLCHASNMHCKIHDIKCAIQDAAWSAEKKVYKSIDYVIENPAKSAAIATTTVTTGAVISKLTGAPLARASLAKLGFGAISIGGKGIAGGKFVIATTTATTTATVTVAASKLNKNKSK